LFQGVDALQTDLGVKLVIGDGGLFSQPLQNITNSDLSNEYGSCENARSVVNTPYGLFYISQEQGKIFMYQNSLVDISNYGMITWLSKYLPSILKSQFPEIEDTVLYDNPVIGIGCQSVYDINYDIVYFSKKDYSVKSEFRENMTFNPLTNLFSYTYESGISLSVSVGDPQFFDDVSWTISFSPKSKAWVSFHDWFPELSIPSTNHFLTTKTTTLKQPYCPPGYTYNISTNSCEKIINQSSPAIVSVQELPATIVGNNCSCPTGYTIVYPNTSSTPIRYTMPNGLCSSLEGKKPICRKVTCNCPPSPVSWATTTTTGECDNLYLTGPNGDPNYVNSNPLICNYFTLDSVVPSLTGGTIWRHNYRCDLYSNYYNVNYPWEIEFTETTGQTVTTLRNVEYQLESYVYKGDLHNGCGDDRWHDLDFNFDEAIIYNTEQVSGLLKLELNAKENPYLNLNYPLIGPNDIKILYTKEEQKYRFNQFWDITKDRGEFTNAEEPIFITKLNGYIKELNAANLDYQKSADQRKKFRHYYNKIFLRKNVSGNRKMLLKVFNTKFLNSPR
jgi:hypothetical protein